ncbi:MAG: TonB-dependent receptor [Acidobacteriota bacterium]|nr:TonB-dependent receptor [Acidobacteriota bacterium]
MHGKESDFGEFRKQVRGIAVAVIGLALAGMLCYSPQLAMGQIASGSLSGTVVDAAGGVIPNAKVVLTNDATRIGFTTASNSRGYFSFPTLQPATYTLTVSATGFKDWRLTGIEISTGNSRTVPNIALQVGQATQTVQVHGNAAIVPLSSGETSTTVNQRMVSQSLIQGRDAAELIKFMPGMAIVSGLGQSPWNSLTTSSNNGPIGNFSANGTQTYGGMQLTLDGGVIIDTGNQGTQIANIDQDQTQEMTIRNSSFTAQYANGPVIMNAISKSGSAQLHGGAYIYGRNGSLNAEDSFLKNQGLRKPIDRYWYPGGDIGGPVELPWTKFNRANKKLFFYGAFEYMDQHPQGSLNSVFVPTAAMKQGDFTAAELKPESGTGWQTASVPCSDTKSSSYANFCGTPAGGAIVNGSIPTAMLDKNGLAYASIFPSPNVDPSQHNGYNYQFLNNPPVNRYEIRGRGDYAATANTRMYVSYDRQHEIDDFIQGNPWWQPAGTLPYPSPMKAIQISDLWSASVTHIFSPSLVNVSTFNYTSFINPLRPTNPSAVTPSAVGLNIKLPYSAGVADAIPNIYSYQTWGNGSMPMIFAMGMPAGFDNGAFGALKRTPSFSDDLSWVKATHVMKFGFYWMRAGNQQTDAAWRGNQGFPQGSFEFENYAHFSTGNPMADLLLGHAQSFNQYSNAPVHNLWYNNVAFYAQDQWKATRRLTVDYGVRFDHMGQWFPAGNTPGNMVWDPSTCPTSAGPGPKCAGPNLPGFQWHAINKSIPLSGFPSRFTFPDPRVGAAYDLFGTGRTVLRGGFGVYRYQLSYNDATAGLDGPLGIQTFSTSCNLSSWADISLPGCLPAVQNGALPGSNQNLGQSAMKMGDDRVPYTETWNFTVDQRGPLNSLFEFTYTGNRSRDELISTDLSNPNIPALGAFFTPDPVTGLTYCQQPFVITNCAPGGIPGSVVNNYRPYNYNGIQIITHGSHANYNALQLSWKKNAGPLTFLLNYTWGKAMGIRDGQTDNGNGNGALIDPYNLQANYGVLAYDRTNIFNALYVFNLPNFVHSNRFVGGVVNGWELSGATQFQTGPPIQPLTGGTLNVSWPGSEGAYNILGTSAGTLVPVLTCDPTQNLKSGQRFNPACFAPPTAKGQNGDIVWPDITGPGYFDSDLGIFKNFRMGERQNLQFRVEAFNFLNHPNPDFTLNGSDLNLSFIQNGGLSMTNTNKNTTGSPLYTTGRRVMEFSIKYSF